ncbi:DUF2029 domain-containing protein [Actinotalea sp. BY-33]|uniref:DUF2029 domain-containing protein n=1 Tax=Actinotalea soli TaxID=2819234 RepID=A0A939LTP3_9CELL|nr:glycosyltransferase 87 family protein [Actinotalea soli]MBO1752810.1 DUF2029 domain-containing protein [Actinotalea soli]
MPTSRRAHLALAGGFLAVHAWLTWLGVVVVPGAAFHDVDLYRSWAYQALEGGTWPVVDGPWVYPAGALVPILLVGLVTATSTVGYALAWCGLVTVLDAVAMLVLLRQGGPGRFRAAWWWLAFLALLGPVAVGRLDAVAAPLMVLALALAARHPALASSLLTAGAWIKVAPGALLVPVVVAASRPLRQVVLPAAAVCAMVLAGVAAGGGLGQVASFMSTQGDRGLQVESVTATGWVLASLSRPDVTIVLDEGLVTYEVVGPGTQQATAVLDLLLPASVAGLAALLVLARRRGTAAAALLPGALALVCVLVVTNKVGSPQLLAWLAAPVVLLLAAGSRPTRTVTTCAGLALGAAGLTQLVFPWGYAGLLTGDGTVTGILAVRNLLLVLLTGWAVALLVRTAHGVRGLSPAGA